MKSDIVLKINTPLDIEFIHIIEKEVDAVLIPLGFSRQSTAHEKDHVEISFRQFGACL